MSASPQYTRYHRAICSPLVYLSLCTVQLRMRLIVRGTSQPASHQNSKSISFVEHKSFVVVGVKMTAGHGDDHRILLRASAISNYHALWKITCGGVAVTTACLRSAPQTTTTTTVHPRPDNQVSSLITRVCRTDRHPIQHNLHTNYSLRIIIWCSRVGTKFSSGWREE